MARAEMPLAESKRVSFGARTTQLFSARAQRTPQDILKGINGARAFVDRVKPWHLDEPTHVRAKELVVADPRRQLAPLVGRPAAAHYESS